MKLDHDLVRYVLLGMEESENISGICEKDLLEYVAKYGDYSREKVAYTVAKLNEAKFITGNVKWASNSPMIIFPGNLTYEGHKFLDNIRDNNVWKDVKSFVSTIGSASLSVISTVAANYISNKLGL